jgi:hypothetical protein
MKRTLLLIGLILITVSSGAQNARRTAIHVDNGQSDAVILEKGDFAEHNLADGETFQLEENLKYVAPEPKMREKVTQPGIVIFKNPDGTQRIEIDWTPGQHARYLMENLRVMIWRYQAGKANFGGTIGVPNEMSVQSSCPTVMFAPTLDCCRT